MSEITVVKVIAGGPKGDKGDPGSGGMSYVHDQVAASLTWVIVHNLNGFPNVTTVDTGGNVLHGTVHYDSANQITVTFTAINSGKAYCS